MPVPIWFLTGAVVDLRGSYGLRPVMGPVEIIRVARVGVLSAEYHAVDEAADQGYEAEY